MDKSNIYRKRECEICGASVFEKFLGVAKELDGGFTQIEDWEESGFGSVVIVYYDIKSVEDSRLEYKLCPDCAEKLNSYIRLKIEALKK